MSAFDLAEIPVEGAEWPVARFPSHLYHEAIRKANRRPPTKLPDRRGNRIRILYCQMLVAQEHLHRRRDGLRATIVDRSEHPRRFGERQVGHPGPVRDKGLGGRHLLRIISSDQPNQYVRVNGPHGAS